MVGWLAVWMDVWLNGFMVVLIGVCLDEYLAGWMEV
jgi:hypothetical protein